MGGRVGAVKEKRKENKMSTKRKRNPITHANRRIRRHIGEFEGISANLKAYRRIRRHVGEFEGIWVNLKAYR